MNFRNNGFFILIFVICFLCSFIDHGYSQQVKLPDWEEPAGMNRKSLLLGFGESNRAGWGHYSPNERAFFDDVLPPVFRMTFAIDSVTGDRGIKWIFTGPREGFYIEVNKNKLSFTRKYYDSFGYNHLKSRADYFPQFEHGQTEIETDKPVRAITVELNYTLELRISINGLEVITQSFIEDVRRNQIHLTGKEGVLAARMLTPEVVEEKVTVVTDETFQQMLGWGGIGTPTAYNQLSEAGKEMWWEYINEYNLLCQREYPVGGLLNYNLDNWDDLRFAKAHYYGDNFPNGEVSDFGYNRKIQDLGGFVMFEFWDFPRWIGNSEKEYARAMVGYCREAVKQTGKAPRIVGIQNEIDMFEENINHFVPELRRTLDAAGFKDVKIHMANASLIKDALTRVDKYTGNADVWGAIDYSATNMYDYQFCFRNPDQFDSTLLAWNGRIKTKPFISTELAVNFGGYQTDSYRLALTMGLLYHKNLTLTNAILIAYCWTILNNEQSLFDATRSLFSISPEKGFIPVPSGNQLRVFGAYSRRIKEGMYRVGTKSANTDLKITAFKGSNNQETMVFLNRSLNPVKIDINWDNVCFSEMEIVDPYSPNIVKPFNEDELIVKPGSIVTVTNVSLNTKQ